jgi:plastocyanin
VKTNKHEEPTWYATNSFKITIGAVCVFLAIALAVIGQLTTAAGSGTGEPGGGAGSVTAGGTVAGSAGQQVAGGAPVAVGSDGKQVVRMVVTNSGYQPSSFTVQVGKPVQWIVDGTQARGCMSILVAPQLGINKKLQQGENVLEFTPTQKGTFQFRCSMGMIRGTMTVV